LNTSEASVPGPQQKTFASLSFGATFHRYHGSVKCIKIAVPAGASPAVNAIKLTDGGHFVIPDSEIVHEQALKVVDDTPPA
jgi:hypothetical protein